MPQSHSEPGEFRVSDLSTRHATRFDLRPDGAERAAIAEGLGIDAVRKLRFEGEISPEGSRGWVLRASLGATVVQPCGVTLAPVTTRIDEDVERRYLPEDDFSDYEAGSETEMPEDDTLDVLGDVISAQAVMTEALSLALPAYPRAPGVELGEAVFAEDGVTPMKDEDTKPFAGLAALRDQLDKKT